MPGVAGDIEQGGLDPDPRRGADHAGMLQQQERAPFAGSFGIAISPPSGRSASVLNLLEYMPSGTTMLRSTAMMS